MPYMDGEDALKQLHKIREDVPVILSSGYGKQEVEARFGDRGFAGFLQKLYKLVDLTRCISEAIMA